MSRLLSSLQDVEHLALIFQGQGLGGFSLELVCSRKNLLFAGGVLSSEPVTERKNGIEPVPSSLSGVGLDESLNRAKRQML